MLAAVGLLGGVLAAGSLLVGALPGGALSDAAQPSSELGFGVALLKMVFALLIVCAVAYVTLRFGVKRLVRTERSGRCLRVVDRCDLGAGKCLWLVEAGDRLLLLGDGGKGVALLAKMPPTLLAERSESRPSASRDGARGV